MRKAAHSGENINQRKTKKGVVMNTVLEKTAIETTEKERHNAMIQERYRKLLDAVEDQFAASQEPTYAPVYTPQPPVVEETPVAEQTPLVREYVATEREERIQKTPAPVAVSEPTVSVNAVQKAATKAAAQYSLTPFAKVAMAVFALLVVTMLLFIGLNSQIIRRKSVRLQDLQEQKQELVEQNEQLRRSIEELQTEESILQRAYEAGLLQ